MERQLWAAIVDALAHAGKRLCRLADRERDPLIRGMYLDRLGLNDRALAIAQRALGEGNLMARGNGDNDVFVPAGGMKEKTFRTGKEGFTFYLFADATEALLRDFPDVKYLSGLAVANTRSNGPDYYLSFFADQTPREQRDGGRQEGRRQERDVPRPREERQEAPSARDPYEDQGASEPPRPARRDPKGSDRPSGNRRSQRGRGRR